MLVNVSYNNKQIDQKITQQVGKPYSLIERFKLKGIGSPKLIITKTSIQIHNLLILDNNRNQCNIEMRPNGIIVGFRSLLESYALVIPYYKLVLYKGKAEEYSIYKDDYFIKIQARTKDKEIHRFVQKILAAKTLSSGHRIEDV